MFLMKIFLMTLPSLRACLPVPQRCPLASAPPAKCHRALCFLLFLLILWSHHIQRKGQHPHPTLCHFLYFEFQGCFTVSEDLIFSCANSCSAPGSGLTPLGAQALLGLPTASWTTPPTLHFSLSLHPPFIKLFSGPSAKKHADQPCE